MVSPRKEHSGATKALRKWHKRCRDPKKSADDILDLALKALDDAHGGGRALLARGAGERTAALLLRAAARKMRTTPPAYLRSVAWSLNELDAFEAAALRLKARLLPGQPDYARLRLARDAARVAAGRAPAWPLIEDDDAAAHAAMLKLAEVADAPGARKMLMEKGGSRLTAFRCAATGRTVLHSVCDKNRRDGYDNGDDLGAGDAWHARHKLAGRPDGGAALGDARGGGRRHDDGGGGARRHRDAQVERRRHALKIIRRRFVSTKVTRVVLLVVFHDDHGGGVSRRSNLTRAARRRERGAENVGVIHGRGVTRGPSPNPRWDRRRRRRTPEDERERERETRTR